MVTVLNTAAAEDSALASTQLTVSWAAPDANGAVILNYTVQWKSGTQDYSGSATPPRQAPPVQLTLLTMLMRPTTITSLTPGTEYTVRVRANVSDRRQWPMVRLMPLGRQPLRRSLSQIRCD